MNKTITLTTCLLALCAMLSAQTYRIGTKSFAIIDPARPTYQSSNGGVYGEIYYPITVTSGTQPVANAAIAPGQFPLIVFGHGFSMAFSEYLSIRDSFVSKGYIVAFPRTQGSISPTHIDFAKDLSFLVTQYLSVENTNTNSFFYQKFIPKAAIMGHSMGGGASVWAAANTPLVTTMCTLAPVNTNAPASSIANAPNVNKPCLMVAGSDDCVANGNQSTGNADSIYNNLRNVPYKAVATITGADHCDFASNPGFTCGLGQLNCGGTISNAVQQQRTFKLIGPWMDYWLKGDCAAWGRYTSYLRNSAASILTFRESGSLPFAPLPIIAAAQTNICPGQSATINATATQSYCSFRWMRDGNVLNTGTSSAITINTPGIYTLEVLNAAGLPSSSNSLTMTSNFNVPSITQSGGILTASAGVSYQWQFGVQDIPNANAQSFTPQISGNYSVVVTDPVDGCTIVSQPFLFTVSGLMEDTLTELKIFPNPTHGLLNVEGVDSESSFGVYDMLGRQMLSGNLNSNQRTIDVSLLVQSTYFLQINTEGVSQRALFCKN